MNFIFYVLLFTLYPFIVQSQIKLEKVTPKISNLFSEMIAIWIISTWENFDKPKVFNIVELGPGDGSLMKILIDVFKKFPNFNNAKKIYFYEKSKLLISKQKKYFNKKTFPYSKKINFNSLRRGEVVGEHEVKFSSGKEIITLNHEAFDRALYSEGAITAAKWLINKKPGLYSMRNLMNFK